MSATGIDRRNFKRRLQFWMAVLVVGAMGAGNAFAQDEPKETQQDPLASGLTEVEPESPVIIRYPISHLDSDVVQRLIALQGMLTGSTQGIENRIVADGSNHIYVLGNAEEHRLIKTILQQFDDPVEPPNSIKVFAMEMVDVTAAAELLHAMFDGQVKVSADPRTNSIVASGTIEQLDLIEALVARLDRRVDATNLNPAGPASYRVILYWLSELGDDDSNEARKVSSELSDVVAELEKRDFRRLTQLGMNEVQVKADGVFQIRGTVSGGSMRVQGQLQPTDDGHIELMFDFQVVHAINGSRGGATAEVETEIVTPLDHNVVLGILGSDPELPDLRNVLVVRIEK